VLPEAATPVRPYGRIIDDEARTDECRVLSVRLQLCLDCEPVRGRLQAEDGTEEHFVGWLGFVDALKRCHDHPKETR
jgi:hypothetical protein